jgi:hypothetical protein
MFKILSLKKKPTIIGLMIFGVNKDERFNIIDNYLIVKL